MDHWLGELRDELTCLEQRSLLRRLCPAEVDGRLICRGGQTLINLGGNDYLGLAGHLRLRRAAIEAIEQHGVGTAASRLVGGHRAIHARIESRFARFKHAEAALLCPTGYTASLAAIMALAQAGDLVCIDKLNHASLIDAARASGATVRVYPHLDTTKLARLLARHAGGSGAEQAKREKPSHNQVPSAAVGSALLPRSPRRFIVTDSVFSMDGDCADLPALCELSDRYDAVLIVDEAHGTGVLGESGAGLCELQNVDQRVDLVISTASKALGALGGIITARDVVIRTIVNRARAFIYTTGAMPAQAAAIGAALDVMRDEPWRAQRLREIATRLRSTLHDLGWLETTAGPATAILPLVVGASHTALSLAEHLEKRGFFAPAIRPPTVAPDAARVRISLRADLTDLDLDRLVEALQQWDKGPETVGLSGS